MSEKEAISIYIQNVEQIKTELGYSLTAKQIKNGWLVFKWYSRNSWSDDTLERKVLLCNGNIFENNIKIGKFLK